MSCRTPTPYLAFCVVGSSPLLSHKDIVNTQTCHHLGPLGLQSTSLLHKPWQVGLRRGNKDSAKGQVPLVFGLLALPPGLPHRPAPTPFIRHENCPSHSSFLPWSLGSSDPYLRCLGSRPQTSHRHSYVLFTQIPSRVPVTQQGQQEVLDFISPTF